MNLSDDDNTTTDTNDDQEAAKKLANNPVNIVIAVVIAIKCVYLITMLSMAFYKIRNRQSGRVKPAQWLIIWMILDVMAVFIYENLNNSITLLFLMVLGANYSFFLIFNASLSLAESSDTSHFNEPYKPWRILVHLCYTLLILWTIIFPHNSVGCDGTRVYPLSFAILGVLFLFQAVLFEFAYKEKFHISWIDESDLIITPLFDGNKKRVREATAKELFEA